MNRRDFVAAAALSPLVWSCTTNRPRADRLPLTFDLQGRPVVGVRIDGRGPFPMAFDTAAQMAGLSADLIAAAGLHPTGGRAMLHGSSGVAEVDIYAIQRLEIGPFSRDNVSAIGMMGGHGAEDAGHSGVIGPSVFSGTRLHFDYAARSLEIADQPSAPLNNAVAMQILHNVFAIVPATVGGVETAVLLDTGARRSLGNTALRGALGLSDDDPRLRQSETIGGATGHVVEAVEADVDIIIAGARIPALPLPFAEAPAFAALGLAQRPAMLIGADMFHRFSRFTIDYQNALFSAGQRHTAAH